MVVVPRSPSDFRALKNLLQEFRRRAGLELG
jgi:hypothetical protein